MSAKESKNNKGAAVNVGFMQFSPLFGRKEDNVERATNAIRGAKADLLVLPELFSTGYLFLSEEELRRSAENIPDGPTVSKFKELAKEEDTNYVLGIAERAGDKLFNSSVLLTPKGDCFVYRKLHLFDKEKRLFSPGDKELEVFDIGKAKVGMMICFDWIFPEVARTLALKGADVICHPSNLILPYCQDAMITRCVENRVFAITSNRTGTERRGTEEMTFTGCSQIVDPRGQILARAGAEEEKVCVAEINPSWAKEKRVTANNHIFEDRRTNFYTW
jgi:predicted amidohydrolase